MEVDLTKEDNRDFEFKTPQPRTHPLAARAEEPKPEISKIVVDKVLGPVMVTEGIWHEAKPYEIMTTPCNRLPDFNDEAGWRTSPPVIGHYIQDNVQNFRTPKSQARVLQGEHLRTDKKMLDRLARNAWDSGFVTFKVEDFSKLAIFGDHCGHVVVLKKITETKLDVPPILRAILEDPYVTKVGKFTYESKLMLQSACPGLKIRGLYDIRWAFPNVFTDREELSFSREAKSVDGLRYPHEQPPRGYNPFKNRWEHIEEEWKMSVIQEASSTDSLPNADGRKNLRRQVWGRRG